MPPRLIRVVSLATAIYLCSSCSQGDVPRRAEDVHETPSVEPTAAPGVAWRYNYDFQLPDDAISVVQETHASQCEALGLARCRITGLRYSVSDDDAVSAMLEVKLAPEIARQFGKQATSEVVRAHGRLSSTEFTGEDTAPANSDAGQAQAEANRRIADIEKQLANRSLRDAERAQLQSQLNDLRHQISEAKATIAQTQAKLASTPMTFNYYGKGGITGFAGSNPVMDAARSFVSSMVTMITIVLQVFAVLLPWAILALLLFLLVRSRVGRAIGRFFSRGRNAEESETS